MENRRSRCVNIISFLIIAVCLICCTDGDDLSENDYGDYNYVDSDTITTADNNSSTTKATESNEVLQAFTQVPTSSNNSSIVQTSPKNRPINDKGTTQVRTSSNDNFKVKTSPKNSPTDDKGTTQVPTSSNDSFKVKTSQKNRPTDDKGTTQVPTSSNDSLTIQTSLKNRPSDDDYDDKDTTRSIDVTVPMQPKNEPNHGHKKWGHYDRHQTIDDDDVSAESEFDKESSFDMSENNNNRQTKSHFDDLHTTRRSGGPTTYNMPRSQSETEKSSTTKVEETEKSSTTVLILAGLIAVIISVGLSFFISYCVASTIVKMKGTYKSEKTAENQGEVPLDQIVCTSVESTEKSSKPCNEEGVSVEVNQHENEQAESKDDGVVVVADNQTNDVTQTTVANEQTKEAVESVTGDKDNNEVSEAAIKLFVEQCMSGATVNNANVQAATGSGVTDPQPTEEASVDATAIKPSVDATNVNAAPIEHLVDMTSLNTSIGAVDHP